MAGKWHNLPPSYQKGGGFKVNGYLALFLLALCVAEAAEINYLFHHRVINFDVTEIAPQTQTIVLPETVVTPDSDYYRTRTFPPGRTVCDAFTICYIKI